MAIAEASFLNRDEGIYLDLKWDLNIVGIPVHSIPAFTSHSLLIYLKERGGGGAGVVKNIKRYSTDTGLWETASWFGDEPAGPDFPIKAGEAYLIYMGQNLNGAWFEGPARGAAVQVSAGLNLVTLPSASEDFVYSNYDMLEDLGDQTQVSYTRRYDKIQGWQSTSWFLGLPSGVPYNTRSGEGYVVYMKEEKENWRAY